MDIVTELRAIAASTEVGGISMGSAADALRRAAEAIEKLRGKELPKEPPAGLLMSMAIRHDHGLGVPGYYDGLLGEGEHEKRLAAALTAMGQIYEEVSGNGFYTFQRPENSAALQPPAKVSQLNWQEDGDGLITARTRIGDYELNILSEGTLVSFKPSPSYYSPLSDRRGVTLEMGKKIAQTDFESRILACLAE